MNNPQMSAEMAKWCNLTYAEKIEERAREAGAQYVRIIKDDPVLAVISVLGNSVIVAFRGTVIANLRDEAERWYLMILGLLYNVGGAVIEDQNLLAAVQVIYGGKAHLGFTALLDTIWGRLDFELCKHVPNRELYLTGHSLGGALATLAAYRLQKARIAVTAVFTFGSPRVLDSSVSQDYHIRHLRFEHKNDIVPQLPPHPEVRAIVNQILSQVFKGRMSLRLHSINYKHVGELRYINENDEIEGPSRFLSFERALNLLPNIGRLVGDHAITDYVRALSRIAGSKSFTQMVSVRCASIKDLEAIVAQGNVQQKITAAQEIGRRGFGSETTYNLLYAIATQECLSSEDQLENDELKQHCLFSLGRLYGVQFPALPTNQIAVIPLASQILQSSQTSLGFKIAAVWSLAMVNRRTDPVVKEILELAMHQPEPGLRMLAKDAVAGKIAPLDTAVDQAWLAPYRHASAADLGGKLSHPGSLEVLLAILKEIENRGAADVTTYEFLGRTLRFDPSLATQESRDFFDTVRRNALWTIGVLNRDQNWLTPSKKLPGLTDITQILKRKTEHESVKLAAVESLWILDRSTDNLVRSILQTANKDQWVSVREAAAHALSGQRCPIPFPSTKRVERD